MIKTQIQLPDELYRAARDLAARREVSVAELCRRGLEYVLSTYPTAPEPAGGWHPPAPRELGAFKAPAHEWKGLAHKESP